MTPLIENQLVSEALKLWRGDVRRRRFLTRQPQRSTNSFLKAAFTVRDLPSSERPRERLHMHGVRILSQQELLACLLGRGFSGESVMVTAQRLLIRFGSLSGIAQASLEELTRVRGIGQAKAAQLIAAFEFSHRLSHPTVSVSTPIDTADAAIQVAKAYLVGRKREHFIALLLDVRHRLIRVAEISVGSLEMSIVHPRELFREAMTAVAAAVIVAHNHPSGDPTPSQEDLQLTRRLKEAGRLLGIPVVDHVIIGREKGLSLLESGFMES